MSLITKSQKIIEEEAKKAVLSELDMTEQCLDEAVQDLKSWLNLQLHLPQVIDPTALRTFIIGCRSVDLAKEKINNYFMARINSSAIISDRIPLSFEWDSMQPMAYLPDLTPEGHSVLFITLPDLGIYPKFSFLQFYRLMTMMWELIIREKPYVTGQICLMNLKNHSFKLLTKLSVKHTSSIIHLFDNCYPLVIKTLYFINTPKAAHSIFRTLIKPIMSESLYKKIVLYTQDEKVLEKHIPIEILPRDYGGNAPTIKDISNEWRLKLENANDLFTGECSLLPEKSKK